MPRRKAEGVPTKVILDPEIRQRLNAVVATSRQTLSGFVQDAIVQRLARWEPAGTFIDRKRRKLGHREQSAFDSAIAHPSGWPKKVPASFWQFGKPSDPIANLKQMILVSPTSAQDMLVRAWRAAGLDAYGDREWEATMAWYKAQEGEATATSETPEDLPPGWNQ